MYVIREFDDSKIGFAYNGHIFKEAGRKLYIVVGDIRPIRVGDRK
jgi:hypothetical protein